MDHSQYLVEVLANVELAPLAISTFANLGAFQVPGSKIVTHGKSKSFYINLIIEDDETMNKLQKISFAKVFLQSHLDKTPDLMVFYGMRRDVGGYASYTALSRNAIPANAVVIHKDYARNVKTDLRKLIDYYKKVTEVEEFLAKVSRRSIRINYVPPPPRPKKVKAPKAEVILPEPIEELQVIQPIIVAPSIKEEPKLDLETYIGRFGYHLDKGSRHYFLCIDHDYSLENVYGMMLTSHINWHKYARKLNKEEIGFLAIGLKRGSYFAPVIRTFDSIRWMENFAPKDLIKNLKEEFFQPSYLQRKAYLFEPQ